MEFQNLNDTEHCKYKSLDNCSQRVYLINDLKMNKHIFPHCYHNFNNILSVKDIVIRVISQLGTTLPHKGPS